MKKRLIIVLLCFLFPLTAKAGNVTVTDAENVEITQNKIVIIRKQNDSQANYVSQPKTEGQTADSGTSDQGSASPDAAGSIQNRQSEGTNSQNAVLAEESGVGESSNTEESSEPAVPTSQNETQEESFKDVCNNINSNNNFDARYDTNKNICTIEPAEYEISWEKLKKDIIDSVIDIFESQNISCDKVEYQEYKKIWSTTCKDNTNSANATATRDIIFDYSSTDITCEAHYIFIKETGECFKTSVDDDEAEQEDATSDVEEAPQEQSNPDNVATTAPEAEGEIEKAETQPKTKDTLIEQLRKDAQKIVDAYTETQKKIEDQLKTPN